MIACRPPFHAGRAALTVWLALAALAPCGALAQQPQVPVAEAASPAASPTLPSTTEMRGEAAPTAAPASPSTPPPAPTPPAMATLPHDLSPWAMFMNADIVVKGVMVGLAFASVVTWTIWVAKSLQLFGARRNALRSIRALLKAERLPDIGQADAAGVFGGGPVTALVHAAAHERDRSADLAPDGIKERVAIALGRVEARAARLMTKGTGLVATIGSTAPFVGLFGTVWGIMNSFVGISQAHTTNLAVVAPGIAEALLATAIGLVAAIPAVIIYNQFARSMAGYKALLSDASAEVMRHLSRDLDRGQAAAE